MVINLYPINPLTDSVLVGVSEEVVNTDGDVVVLEVVHEVSAIAAHLHVRAHCAEHDLCEPLRRVHAETDPADRLLVLDQRQCLVFTAITPWVS